MTYPPECIDYVVVHELAHLRHRDHGSAFYSLIASVLPDYKARRKLLRYGGFMPPA
jgi:predicted metal-dependent hydrolase